MKFPFVTRKKYDRLIDLARKVNDENIRLKIENDTILGNACELADIERKDREQERGHFEAILTNLRGGQ